MKLFPNKEFTITTHLSVDEVKEKLLQLFNKERGKDFYYWTNYIIPNGKYYTGNYWGDEFYFIDQGLIERKPRELFRNTTYANYKGLIESNESSTKIVITQKVGFLVEATSYGNLVFSSLLLIWVIVTKADFIPLIITPILIILNVLVLYTLKKRFHITEVFLREYFDKEI